MRTCGDVVAIVEDEGIGKGVEDILDVLARADVVRLMTLNGRH